MTRNLRWRDSISARLGTIVLGVLIVSSVLVAAALYTLGSVHEQNRWTNLVGRGRMHCYHLLYLAQRVVDEPGEGSTQILVELNATSAEVEERFTALRMGDSNHGIPVTTDSRMLDHLAQREKVWGTEIRPLLARLSAAKTRDEAVSARALLRPPLEEYVRRTDEGISIGFRVSDERVARFRAIQIGLAGGLLGVLFALGLIARSLSRRARALVTTAERITEGELALHADVSGRDELATLGQAFNAMTTHLRATIETEKQGHAREAAQESRLRAILNSTPDGIITIDDRGIISSYNAAAERLFGRTAAEALGKNVSMLMPSPHKEAHDGYIERYLRTGNAKILGNEREVEGLHRDGSRFHVSLWVSEMRHEGQRAFVGVVQDIGRRKKAEEANAKLIVAITQTAGRIASATAQILAGTSQQAAGMQEQAAAVAQTVATVDEVVQTSMQAAERARAVAESSQRSVEIGKTGRRAIEDSVMAMTAVKEYGEATAESIVALAEQAQAIGEIIATVSDIAEQTNLLALNAAIEASRAGEHGRGFSVVASEVKVLAEQSKKATAQVRQILGEIQKATNGAVLATEDGSRSIQGAMRVVGQAGDTIKVLGDTIGEAAQAGTQISASAGQQAGGMAQIHDAMKNINQVTVQTLASTKQTEHATHDLNALAGQLNELLAGIQH